MTSGMRSFSTQRSVTLEQLRSFVALADERHFARAAAAVHISPSPFSKRIRELEATVGATLVQRTTRSVQLTKAGTTLLPIARDLLRSFDRLRWVVREDPVVGIPEIRIGTPHGGMQPADRAALTDAVRRALGTCRTAFETVHPQDVDERLRSGAIHLAVLNTLGQETDYTSVTVRVEQYGVALRADHHAASGSELTLASLRQLTHASIRQQPLTPNQLGIIARLREAGLPGEPLLVDDVTELANLLVTQPTFAFVPLPLGSAYSRALDEPEIAIRPIPDLGLSRHTLAVWRDGAAEAHPALPAIADEVRRTFASEAADPTPRASAPVLERPDPESLELRVW
jgi:DNA-binding transcriptional LysR family regulator